MLIMLGHNHDVASIASFMVAHLPIFALFSFLTKLKTRWKKRELGLKELQFKKGNEGIELDAYLFLKRILSVYEYFLVVVLKNKLNVIFQRWFLKISVLYYIAYYAIK